MRESQSLSWPSGHHSAIRPVVVLTCIIRFLADAEVRHSTQRKRLEELWDAEQALLGKKWDAGTGRLIFNLINWWEKVTGSKHQTKQTAGQTDFQRSFVRIYARTSKMWIVSDSRKVTANLWQSRESLLKTWVLNLSHVTGSFLLMASLQASVPMLQNPNFRHPG